MAKVKIANRTPGDITLCNATISVTVPGARETESGTVDGVAEFDEADLKAFVKSDNKVIKYHFESGNLYEPKEEPAPKGKGKE